MRDAAFFFIWVVLLPISFYSAHIGVLLWIWVALLSPNELLYGVMAGVPFNKIVAGSTVLILAVSREKKQFYLDRLIVLIVLFGVVGTISYFGSLYPGPIGDHAYDKFIKEIVLALLITGIMWSRHRLHQAALVIAIGYGFLMAKEGLIFLLTAGGHKVVGTGSTGDNNGLALAILMTIPYTLFVAKYASVKLVRTAIYATAGLGVVTVVASFSRGGFVGLVVLALMLLQGTKHKVRGLVLLLLGAAAIYYFAPDTWFSRIDTIAQADDDSSFVARMVAWKINFLLALDHPFFGGGPYASLVWQTWVRYLTESTTLLFPTPMVNRTLVAHSIYFQVLGDMGFTGLALFLAMLGTAFFMARRTRRLARGIPSLAWAADLARALEISLVVYGVAGAALSLVYFELLFITLAMVTRTHQTVVQLTAPTPATARAALPGRMAPAYRTT